MKPKKPLWTFAFAERVLKSNLLGESPLKRVHSGPSPQKFRNLPFEGFQTDTRSLRPGEVFVAIEGERHDGHDHLETALRLGARGALVRAHHPKAPVSQLQRLAKVYGAWICEVESVTRAYRLLGAGWRKQFSIPIVAVAGSVGKTTTKEILATVLRAHFTSVLHTEGSENGFLGIPKTLLKLRPEHRAAVIEVGIDEPGTMRGHLDVVQPTHAWITAIGPEHLEKLIDLETVAREETAVYEWMIHRRKSNAWGVPLDDPWLAPFADRTQTWMSVDPHPGAASPHAGKGLWIQAHEKAILEISLRPGGKSLKPKIFRIAYPLPGTHNRANAAAAWTLARMLGVPPKTLQRALPKAKPAFGRTEISTLPGDVRVIRDYYNANPASMAAAFRLLRETPAQRRFCVLGDMRELGTLEEKFHRDLASPLANSGKDGRIDGVWCLGSKMAWLADELRMRQYTGKIEQFDDATSQDFSGVEELARSLASHLRPGDVVLIKGSRGMRMERIWEFLTHGRQNQKSSSARDTAAPSHP